MNIDLLKDNPAWTSYLYLAILIFAAIMLAVLLLKQKGHLHAWRSLFPVLRAPTKSSAYSSNLEMQHQGRLESVGTVGDKDTFCWAAEHGFVELLKLELSKGINIEDRSREGETALQIAAGGGHMSVVEFLLKEGAKVNAPVSYKNRRTALQAAAECGHMLVVERLLKEGAEVNAPASTLNGRTALQAAAGGGHTPIVECLLKGGAEANAPASDENRRIALQAAAGGGNMSIVSIS
jgi:ankyrin repeat protein